jgi:hypothetical protein
MPVMIRINKNAVEAQVLGAWDKGLALLSEEILNDCNTYCKERTGALIASSLIHSVPAEGKLIWQTPYAQRQYWEIQTAKKDINQNASWKWCEVAKTKHKKQWAKQAKKLLEMNL